MAKPGTVLAIDQGTTSSRAIVFGPDLSILGSGQREFTQHYPASGWVEHDPEDIWRTTVETARQALAAAGLGASDIAAIGITNQRETCVVWDRRTGRPIHRAIVWQDRRTADACRNLKRAGHEPGGKVCKRDQNQERDTDEGRSKTEDPAWLLPGQRVLFR